MRIIVVSASPILPINNGSTRFINDYCRLLTSLGNEVYFLWIRYYEINKAKKIEADKSENDMQHLWKDHLLVYRVSFGERIREFIIRKYCTWFRNNNITCDFKYENGIHKYVNKINQKYCFDACIVNYFWLSKLLSKVNIAQKAIITHDSFSLYNLRNNTHRILNMMPNEEAKYLQRCPVIFAMQSEEAIYFKYLAPHSKVLINYNFSEYNTTPITGNHNILFLSGPLYASVNGIRWFVEEVFPHIIKDFPDSKLLIAGSICKLLSDYKKDNSIKLLGCIKDPKDFYTLGDIAINPTYQGSGLKIKTIEAMSYGKVTIVHPHSTCGLYHHRSLPLLVSSSPQDWLSFFHCVWDNSQNFISKTKYDTKDYIEEMNKFVKSQFIEFLNQK